jgi:subtilisin-like proprotein convertase family protein
MTRVSDEEKLVDEIVNELIEKKCIEASVRSVVRSKILKGEIGAGDWRIWVENSVLRPVKKAGATS